MQHQVSKQHTSGYTSVYKLHLLCHLSAPLQRSFQRDLTQSVEVQSRVALPLPVACFTGANRIWCHALRTSRGSAPTFYFYLAALPNQLRGEGADRSLGKFCWPVLRRRACFSSAVCDLDPPDLGCSTPAPCIANAQSCHRQQDQRLPLPAPS